MAIQKLGVSLREETEMLAEEIFESLTVLAKAVRAVRENEASDLQWKLVCFLVPEMLFQPARVRNN